MFGLVMPPWIMIAKYAAIVLVCLGIGAYGAHRWDTSTIADMKLADATAANQSLKDAVTRIEAQDKKTHDADVAYAESRQKTVTVTQEIIRNVPKYITVQDDAACKLPDNFGRLLDAAQLGVDPDALPAGATKPDSAAPGLSLSQATGLLAQILGDYASVRGRLLNAQAAWPQNPTK